ncbi:MAG: HAD family phosphatase [Chitinophagales bacterium]|nr:HAD family phosphatase [Chitinophagales bacterium]
MRTLQNVDNIIFDLGEVILDLNPQNTIHEFNKLMGKDSVEHYSFSKQSDVFDKFETGKITAAEFRNELRAISGKDVVDEDIDHAWNAMLVGIPKPKLEILKKLKDQFQTFVLSNTNCIHIKWVNNYMEEHKYGKSLNEFFDAVYYSHDIGFRKPDDAAYTYILKKHHIPADRSLFIDDRIENIETAARLGIKTFHMKNRHSFFGLFEEYM